MNIGDFDAIKRKLINKRIMQIEEAHSGLLPKKKRIEQILVEYNNLEQSFRNSMDTKRLDCHKICACLCMAIMKSQPYDYVKEGEKKNPFLHIANECLALQVSLDLLSYYIKERILKTHNPYSHHFKTIEFPDLISDKKTNFNNLVGSLYRSRYNNQEINNWLLAHLFYHIHAFNALRFLTTIQMKNKNA